MKKNIFLLFYIQALRWFLLVIPIIVLFYQENGLSLLQVFALQAVFAFAVVVIEIPSGYFADLWGRRTSLLWGAWFSSLGFLCYSLSTSFEAFLIAELLLAVGAGLVSGADSALIYDSLLLEKKEQHYALYEGRYMSIGSFSEGIASILGGLLAFYSLRLPFLLQTVLAMLTIPLSFALSEPERRKTNIQSNRERWLFLWQIVWQSLWLHKKLRWIILLSASFGASTLHIVWLIQPYFKQVQLPIYFYGVLWALLQFSVGFFAWHAWRLEKLLQQNILLLFLIFAIGFAYILPAIYLHLFSIVFFFLAYLSRGVNAPLLRKAIQDLSESNKRATVLSIKSMLVRLIFSFTAPIAGMIADINLSYSLLASGLFFFLLTLFFWFQVYNSQSL